MENTLRHQQPYTDFSRIIRVKSEYIKEGQKIMDDKKVARINELYHKSKAEGLTPEELKEQQILRKEYIDSFKKKSARTAKQHFYKGKRRKYYEFG